MDTRKLYSFVAILLLCSFSLAKAQENGSFVGRIVAEWLLDGRAMKLLEPFTYIDPRGLRWDAPAGATVDGASIPRFAWSIIGGPFEGNYRNASVIHDVACEERMRKWEAVHEAFYSAMLASGVSWIKAKIMYAAVYHFGPRWGEIINVERNVVTPVLKNLCIKLPQGGPQGGFVCNQVTEMVSRTIVVPAIVTPPDYKITPGRFEELEASIESREVSSSPMSLEEIRNFQ